MDECCTASVFGYEGLEVNEIRCKCGKEISLWWADADFQRQPNELPMPAKGSGKERVIRHAAYKIKKIREIYG